MRKRVGAILKAVSVPLLGSLRYALAMALLCGAWIYDARLLNAAFDMNLALIKGIGSNVDGSGRVEAALRGLSAERMLLFTEAGILVWLTAKLAWFPFACLLAARRSARTTGPAN